MEIKEWERLIKVFEESCLYKMEFESEEAKIKLEKYAQNISNYEVPIVETKRPIEEIQEEVKKETIKSPLVGTFYRASGEKEKPFVKEGDYVNENDVICIIEAMKVMNEIKAGKSGVISKILVGNGEIVQFDQDLMEIGE